MKPTSNKPRICLAIPNINYLSYSPRVLSTLPIVRYLEEEFHVTVVLRKVLEPQSIDFKYLTILDPERISEKEKKNRHGYYHPGIISALKYRKLIDSFAEKYAKDFDLVIEKEWPLLGALSESFSRYKVPTVAFVIAEFKYPSNQPFWQGNPVEKALKWATNELIPQYKKRLLQKVNSLIVETEEMKSFMIENNYAKANTPLYPIPMGIEPEIFFPRVRRLCREQLGINQDACVLVYVGSLNRYIQEPGPIIEALGREKPKNAILHIVGDGEKRKELEAIANQFESPVVFHGRRSQKEAALFIGAANLCVAPYNTTLFSQGKFTCSSLKVPEYFACGRPTITIPCERMDYLLDEGRYGYLVNNTVDKYREFFRNLPTLEEISEKENALVNDLNNRYLKRKKIVLTWRDVAEMYAQVINENLSRRVLVSR